MFCKQKMCTFWTIFILWSYGLLSRINQDVLDKNMFVSIHNKKWGSHYEIIHFEVNTKAVFRDECQLLGSVTQRTMSLIWLPKRLTFFQSCLCGQIPYQNRPLFWQSVFFVLIFIYKTLHNFANWFTHFLRNENAKRNL